ncbi:lysophospholipid acyltransferase family protein [Lichenicola sp.]|uniref:lysophospholipid acyltransferase family protein n=1 Tax=Lichenicola sp. TaxID=2804529 RepID=UPI003AFF75AB
MQVLPGHPGALDAGSIGGTHPPRLRQRSALPSLRPLLSPFSSTTPSSAPARQPSRAAELPGNAAARATPRRSAAPNSTTITLPNSQAAEGGSASPVVRLFRTLRVARRGVAILGWTGIACCIQSVLLLLPGRAKADFARAYWSIACVLLGMRIRVIGSPMPSRDVGTGAGQARRPVIYVSNHSSWIDVPVLGGRLLACFVAKEDVGGWPLVGTVARLGRTIFVSRQRKATGRERDDMRKRLAGGDDLILFPEGTSSDGSRVLPFHSSFFAAAKPNGGQGASTGEGCDTEIAAPCPLVQPISIVYDRLGGLPIGRSNRPVFAWYGDMDLASHFTRLARWRGMRATIMLHPMLDPADFPTRKALSIAAWTVVAEGAAALRQNRIGDAPVKIAPQAACHPVAETFPLDSTGPSFA